MAWLHGLVLKQQLIWFKTRMIDRARWREMTDLIWQSASAPPKFVLPFPTCLSLNLTSCFLSDDTVSVFILQIVNIYLPQNHLLKLKQNPYITYWFKTLFVTRGDVAVEAASLSNCVPSFGSPKSHESSTVFESSFTCDDTFFNIEWGSTQSTEVVAVTAVVTTATVALLPALADLTEVVPVVIVAEKAVCELLVLLVWWGDWIKQENHDYTHYKVSGKLLLQNYASS